jgi:hypothetical protein
VWKPTLKAYSIDNEQGNLRWEDSSSPVLRSIDSIVSEPQWIQQLVLQWSQESNRANSNTDVRGDNFQLVKMIGLLCSHSEDFVD